MASPALNRKLAMALKEKAPNVRYVDVGIDADVSKPGHLRVWAEVKFKGGVVGHKVCGFIPLPIDLEAIYPEMERIAKGALLS